MLMLGAGEAVATGPGGAVGRRGNVKKCKECKENEAPTTSHPRLGTSVGGSPSEEQEVACSAQW